MYEGDDHALLSANPSWVSRSRAEVASGDRLRRAGACFAAVVSMLEL